MLLPPLPITSASSTSQSRCEETSGISGTVAPGLFTAVDSFVKKTGYSGNFSGSPLARSDSIAWAA